MDMIERVARAMAENAGFNWDACAQSQWKSDARAGIEAMWEPTPLMKDAPSEAGVMAGDYTMHSGEAENAWRAMIAAALKTAE